MDTKTDLLEASLRIAIEDHLFADPLSDDFDKDKLLDFLKMALQPYDSIDLNISTGKEMLYAILDLNTIYEQLMSEIIVQIDKINLSNSELIRRILAHINFDYCNAVVTTLEQKNKNSPSQVANVSELSEHEYTNIFGQKGNIGDAIDTSVDVCNELLAIIHNLEDIDETKQHVDESALASQIRQLFFAANYLVNLKEAFSYIKYEFGTISHLEGEILFKHEPQYYYLVRLTGKDRESSHTQEGHFYLMDAPTPNVKMQGVTSTDTNTLVVEGERSVPMINLHNPIVYATTYYSHLEGYQFSKLKNISIYDILYLLSILQAPFQLVDASETVNKSVQLQKLGNVPIRIEKKQLINLLKDVTKIPEQVIESILHVITDDWSKNCDLWRFPLISSGKYYYFALAPVAHGHITFLADQVISKFLAQSTQEKLFIKFLKKSIEDWDSRYKISVADASILKSLALEGNFLVVALGSTCVVIEACLFPYPLSSKRYREAIDLLFIASKRLNEKKGRVLAQVSKLFNTPITEIVGLVISNHPLLSGLIVEDAPVLDFIAFKNYFTIGEYRRSTLSFKDKSANTTTLSSYKYYDTEEEFGSKFAQFAFRCPLIHEKMKAHKIQLHEISFPESRPRVLRDGAETIKLGDSIWDDIHDLDLCLKQMFYFGDEMDRKPELTEIKKASEERIEYLMPIVLNYMAMDRTDRFARNELLSVFKNSKLVGMAYLIFGLDRLLVKLAERPIKKKQIRDKISIDHDKAEVQMKRFLEMNMKPNLEMSLSTWETKNDFTESERVNLLGFLETFLSSVYQKKYTEAELDGFMLPLVVYVKVAGDDKRYRSSQYSVLVNFVELLNYSGYYQKARDFSEEVLEFSFRNSDHPNIGWLVLFKCFLKQNSVFDAAFYGNLYFAALITIGEIDEEEAFDGIYNTMLFARQFGYDDMVESTYLTLKSFPLSGYNSQKISISYFNSKLSDAEDFNAKREEIIRYIGDNIAEITEMETYAVVPWLVLLYNIQSMIKNGFTDLIEELEGFLARLESQIPKKEIEYLRALVFPSQASKEIFFDALVRAYETRQFEDFASEMASLRPLVYHTFLHSIEPPDVKSLILTGLVLNDNRLTFQASEPSGLTSRFARKKEDELRGILNDYSTRVLSGIRLKTHQMLIWLVEIGNVVFCVRLSPTSEVKIERQSSWDIERQRDWIKRISSFAFDDKVYFPINVQEEKYVEVLDQLNFAKLHIEDGISELLVATSITMSNFPANLLQFRIGAENNLSLHEERVKEAIQKNNNFDFASYHIAVSNVISWEWLSVNGSDVSIGPANQLTLQAWIPTADGDFVLAMGYAKLKPIFDKYKGTIATELVPKNPLRGKINVFMAHGGKGFEGFRGVYSSHEAGHAYLQDRKRMEKVYGIGEIAVLFICSSALISREIYVQRLVSFTNEILAMGYKAVIAPAWDLNPLTTPFWLDKFLENLLRGHSASLATQLANVYTSKNGFDENTGFYFPAGWAAMHYYGNPNIYLDKD